ncbi:hypothetical protein E2K73_03305 [Acinetobacter sp. RF15A]|uniref:hypothetical protein n=1 Tax=unclassified Acinetobacter TaxID=196816 RepID=UPI00118EC097|nr:MULTISPECIES: hypothetical protein [unclassified Acinetobacter]TSH77793.1 hypothetical protein E2K73_03305 [Acinetobacter sp. RF15A]TSI21229.1 hypothetical protein E2K74_01385 [Acinetobacter sp. RF15B]
MHQTVKIIFRLCFAAVIFIVTLSLVLTCFIKVRDIMNAEQHYQQATPLSLKSDPHTQYVLLSNNQKPDNTIFILIAGNGYIAKISCDHYPALCTDDYNQSHTRQIQTIDLIKAGNFFYIKNIQYRESRSGQVSHFNYSPQELQQFYKNDIYHLKFIVVVVALFALAALFVSLKILRNFRQFLNK